MQLFLIVHHTEIVFTTAYQYKENHTCYHEFGISAAKWIRENLGWTYNKQVTQLFSNLGKAYFVRVIRKTIQTIIIYGWNATAVQLQRHCNAGGIIRREVFICVWEREPERERARESPRNHINLNVATQNVWPLFQAGKLNENAYESNIECK
jgi:hypothetical protein